MKPYPQPFTIQTLTDMLVADADRLDTVKYAELGIPMFLVGEDLTTGSVAKGGPVEDGLGARLAQLASVLSLHKPDLDLDDVAKIIEILAERYFLLGTTAVRDDPLGALAPAVDNLALPAAAPAVLEGLVAGLSRSRAIRLLNFHATPRYREAEFRAQIAAYAQVFEPITPENFGSAVDGSWSFERPGLMPALYEGYRDNLDVILPILEEYGFTGWFFIPTAFPGVAAHEQRAFAAAHRLHLPEHDEYPDDRVALTWNEIRAIRRRGHAFVCHTRTHHEVTPETPREVLENEIVAARQQIVTELNDFVNGFCWLEGAEIGVNAEADEMLIETGFRYLFSNFKVQKLW